MENAIFAGGCFWCTEALFKRIKGVQKVIPGYTGGKSENPNYKDVSSGQTGHAEAIRVTFDPKKISYQDLLYIFFRVHDPTTLNKQGADVGTQYRSAIFYSNETQKDFASKAKLEAQKIYNDPIVTEIVPLNDFYPAENYHQNYYENNPNQTYCKIVIDPKIKKLETELQEYIS